MREVLGAALCVLSAAFILMGNLSYNDNTTIANESSFTEESYEEADESSCTEEEQSEESQEQSEYTSTTSSSSEDNLPDSLYWDSENETIKYVTPDMTLRVYFSDVFYILYNYQPDNGICLTSDDGAVLLIDTMDAQDVTVSSLSEFLKLEYPDSSIYITDGNDIVCVRDYTDENGNDVTCFLLVRITDSGYFEVSILCHYDKKSEYADIFESIEISNLT